jgi:hypothetical protein
MLAVVARPSLWSTALRVWAGSVPPRWWRRPPYLPTPDRAYLRFRLETAYGPGVPPEPRDLVTYLRWVRERRTTQRLHAHR